MKKKVYELNLRAMRAKYEKNVKNSKQVRWK